MSDPTPAPDRRTFATAMLLAERGFWVFPCRPWGKEPATANGFYDATTDPVQIAKWFDNDRGLNLAVRAGLQPNGVHLLAVDIDPKNGGDKTWEELCSHHGTPLAPRHETPSGGFHLFFNAEGLRNTAGLIGKGIDTRGDGGYVVVPPSKLHDANGEIIRYEHTKATSLATKDTVLLPDWLRALAEVAETAPREHHYPPAFDGPADLLRAHWDWYHELSSDGWQQERTSGGDVHWVRPGKAIHGGKSATLHPSGAFVVWTSERPAGGLPTRGSDGSTYSPWDYVVNYRFAGNTSAAAKWVYQTYGVATPGAGGSTPTPGLGPVGYGPEVALNLPEAFWDQREVLAHIRQAARSGTASPEGLLVHALARSAAYIHPCYKLPGVEQGLIGKPQTLDFLGCVVAETSGGKTLAAGVGELLIPAPEPAVDGSDPTIDFEQKVGSGEGIAEFFLVPEMREDEEGRMKATGKRVVGKQALFMNVDEGTGFTNQAGRKGTTIVSTLASAWSGEALGQLNAAEQTRRLVQGGRVRICAVINMQDSNGYKLYSDELESTGFTGRLLFATAHDELAPPPAERPDWPGPLKWVIPPGFEMGVRYYTYDPEIQAEIVGTRHAILTKKLSIDKRQSQYLLLRCKVAAILATWEGRLEITLEDWAIATQIVGVSSVTLGHLDTVRLANKEVTAVTAAEFQLNVASKAASQHTKRLQVGWSAKVLERLRKKPVPWKGLKDIVEAGPRRDELRQAVDDLVDDGVIILDGSTYSLP